MLLGAVVVTSGDPWAARLSPAGPGSQSSTESSTASGRVLLDRYCVTCHNERLQTAGLVLDTLDIEHVGERAAVWEKVVRKLRSGTMPPVGRPRPDPNAYDALVSSLETALDTAAVATPHPGRPAVHRLNRAEYANAVRDLLGVEIDARAYLPADDSGYGFDNIADVLSVSPGLLERYLVAAGKIGRLAISDPTVPPVVTTYRVPPLLVQNERMSEDLPFGTRGGIARHHHFPADGEYIVRVRLQRTSSDSIRGLADSHQLEIRLDGVRAEAYTVGGALKGQPLDFARRREYGRTADAGLEATLAVSAGSRLVGVAFVNEPKLKEGVFRPLPPIASYEYTNITDTPPSVESVEIEGPFNATAPGDSVTRRKIFACYPTTSSEELPCARTIIGALAHRAFRRPVTGAEVDGMLEVYETGRRRGSFDSGIEWVIERILVDPDFLFRIERDPVDASPGAPYRISDLELASRLSFFLWSSLPDDELLELAERGRLRDPAVLEAQVRRMLSDDRSSALLSNFAGQWLWQRNLQIHAPDPDIFSDFDDNLRQAFQTETQLFLESQLREDRSVLELLTADYTFVNERLARHYGMPSVYGSHFRRVQFIDDARGGLLGHGSILTVTSYAHRTSPVVRGKWLLENILGAPPPPPPANVPALEENDEGGRPTSVRERMEAHRRNPVCASCHAPMDPLGFALENFDATGRWRDSSASGDPIDASGTFPDGTRFDGPAEFREALVKRGDEFVTTLTERLLTYALGRGLEYYDMPAVRGIVRQSASDRYRWSSLFLGIVTSQPFQMRAATEGVEP